MTLAEFRETQPLAETRKLEATEFKFLWISGYWDGPMSGLLRSANRDLWFEWFADGGEHDSWGRRYAVVELPADRLALERKIHADFQRFVGTHMDGDGSGGGLKPAELHPLFYEKHGGHDERVESFPVVAWFER